MFVVKRPKGFRSYCLYMIRNRINRKIYVGQTGKWEQRYIEHTQKLRAGNHPNKRLQADWDEYEEDSFDIYVLLTDLRIEEALDMEREYIHVWQTINPEFGYNQTSGGQGANGHRHSAETRARWRPESRASFAQRSPMSEPNPSYARERLETPISISQCDFVEIEKRILKTYEGDYVVIGVDYANGPDESVILTKEQLDGIMAWMTKCHEEAQQPESTDE